MHCILRGSKWKNPLLSAWQEPVFGPFCQFAIDEVCPFISCNKVVKKHVYMNKI